MDEEFAPPPDHDEDDIYFGDFWGHLFPGYLRCTLFQFGGLPTGVREPKEHKFFNILRRYKISIAFLQELGLNWYALSDSQQWLRRVRHELDSNEARTRCCHNTKSLISEDRQWGGTGILAWLTLRWVMVATRPGSADGPGLDFWARKECTFAVSVSTNQPPTKWVHLLSGPNTGPTFSFKTMTGIHV